MYVGGQRLSLMAAETRHRMRFALIPAAAAALLWTSYSSAAPIGDPRPCNRHCEIQRFLDQNVGIRLDKPVTLADLRKFAKVVSENTTKVGTHGLSDTIYVFRYPGLEVWAEVTAENSVLIRNIDLTGGSYRMAFNIKLGPIEDGRDIDTVLGPPTETRRPAGKPVRWVYQNLEGTAMVVFERMDNAIVGVHWDYSPGD
jgi:hypothetical protein